jgi:hypothetical protein
MANCVNCYETNTIEPCESVGCLSTNYGKCITYSGSNLFCEKGSVNTFTFTGTAVAPTTTTTVEVVATGGTGSDVTFNVTRTAGQITYLVTLSDGGSAYTLGDTLTIAGTALGGASPANNITITVTALAPIIATGDDLDSIITNFNARLCSAGDGYNNVDLSGYNYYCLRLGGNLESVGAPITNAQGVVESMSAALCSLNTRLKSVEKPAITVASCFTGTLTSGTSTLVQILNEYGSKICTHNTNLTMTGVTGNPCISYSWTAKPTSNNISEYINWVSTNVCGIFTLLNGNIGAVSVKEQEIRNYITGTTTGTIPTSINTSCLTGGSTTSSLKDAMTLIVSQLCATITTVSSLAPSSYTVSYGSCFNGTYPSNSIFNVQSLGTFTSSTTLQTHLNQIASALGALNIKFNSSQFTIASTPCGPTISLLSGSTFSCSSLSTCSISNLGDVNVSTPTNGQFLTYNTTTSEWQNKNLDVLMNGSSTNVTKTINSFGTTFDLNISAALSGTNYYYRTSSPGYGTILPTISIDYPVTKAGAAGWPYLAVTGTVGHHIGGFRINFTGAQTFAMNNWYIMYYTNVPFTLDSEVVVPVTMRFFAIGSSTFTNYQGVLKLSNVSGSIKVEVQLQSPSVNAVNGDYFEIICPTITFTTI